MYYCIHRWQGSAPNAPKMWYKNRIKQCCLNLKHVFIHDPVNLGKRTQNNIYYKTVKNRFVCNPVTYHPFRHLEFYIWKNPFDSEWLAFVLLHRKASGTRLITFVNVEVVYWMTCPFFTFVVLKFTDETPRWRNCKALASHAGNQGSVPCNLIRIRSSIRSLIRNKGSWSKNLYLIRLQVSPVGRVLSSQTGSDSSTVKRSATGAIVMCPRRWPYWQKSRSQQVWQVTVPSLLNVCY